MTFKLPKYTPLFRDRLETLSTTKEASERIDLLFKVLVDITWNKIDWRQFKEKIDVGYDPQNIIPALKQLLKMPIDKRVCIVWNDWFMPSIEVDLDFVIEHFEVLISNFPYEKFIFNPYQGYVVEVLISDQMTAGLIKPIVPIEEAVLIRVPQCVQAMLDLEKNVKVSTDKNSLHRINHDLAVNIAQNKHFFLSRIQTDLESLAQGKIIKSIRENAFKLDFIFSSQHLYDGLMQIVLASDKRVPESADIELNIINILKEIIKAIKQADQNTILHDGFNVIDASIASMSIEIRILIEGNALISIIAFPKYIDQNIVHLAQSQCTRIS